MGAWLGSHTPSQGIEDDFSAYLPLDPGAYLALAEPLWADATDNPWGQQLLLHALLRWRDSDRVLPELVRAFERWLGYVPIRGYPGQRGQHDENVEEVQAEIAKRSSTGIQPGPFWLGGYGFTFTDDDGLLRLGRAALAVISHMPRSAFLHAIATGCLAEALADFADKYELFEWVIRLSDTDMWTHIEPEVQSLLTIGSVPALEAAYRLLSCEGSIKAVEARGRLPADLFLPNEFMESLMRDPCSAGFTWRREDCVPCLQRTDVDPDWIARQIAPYCADPKLAVPDYLPPKFSALADGLKVEEMWLSLGSSREEFMLESITPTLWAHAPEAMGRVIQRAVKQLKGRSDTPLRQLAVQLRRHSLILTAEDRELARSAWKRLLPDYDSRSQAEREGEFFLFPSVIFGLGPKEQIGLLLSRPGSAPDLVSFAVLFEPITDWGQIRGKLAGTDDVREVQRILWFATSSGEHIPPEIARAALPFLKHADSMVRAWALKALLLSKDVDSLDAVVMGEWSWKAEQVLYETHWGSLLLCESGTRLPYEELRCRVHPAYLGIAVRMRGAHATEVAAYAGDLHRMWRDVAEHGPDLPADMPELEVSSEQPNNALDLTLFGLSRSAYSRSVEFGSRKAYWGGMRGTAEWHWPSDAEIEEQNRRQSEVARGGDQRPAGSRQPTLPIPLAPSGCLA